MTSEEITSEIAATRRQIGDINDQLNALTIDRSALQHKLDKLLGMQAARKIYISDHAMLRYLERAKGVNVEQLRGEIITDQLIDMVSTLGTTGEYPVGEGKIALKNGTITTYIQNK